MTATVVVITLVGAGVVALRTTGALESLELGAYDWCVRLRAGDATPDSRIVLVTISESDIRAEGRWPLPDATLAKVIDILAKHRPRAIGLDIYRDVPVPPGSEILEAALTRHAPVIGVLKFGGGSSEGIAPHPALAARAGFSDIVVDRGGIVRRGLLFLDDGTAPVYSFALRLALLYLKSDGVSAQPDPRDPSLLRLGGVTIPPLESHDGPYIGADARGYQFLLDFKGGRRPFTTISLRAVLSEAPGLEGIRDRIVIAGVTSEGVKDFFYTPYSHGFGTDQPMPAIALHAHIASQLLRMALDGAAPQRTMRGWQETLWILLWSALGGCVGFVVRSPARFAFATGAGVITVGLLDFLAFAKGWWLPLVPPAIGWVVSSALVTAYVSYQEKLQRSMLMQLFSRHVSREVAETIWLQRDEFLDGGRPRPRRLVATVLFSDLVGFTSIAETLEPQVLVEWLGDYIDTMTQQVIHHGGVINKYMGDAIMALFGVPFARTTEAEIARDATAAVSCALAMEASLVELNRRWRTESLPTMGMRIGIFTGPLVAGTFGSTERSEYTVVGDTVNSAARLESFDKAFLTPDPAGTPCRILIGESTSRYLDEAFETKPVGEVALKGKGRSVSVFHVLRRRDTVPPATTQEPRP